MTPVSPYLRRYAFALMGGAAIATLAVNIAPGAYYDTVEWQPFDSAVLQDLRLFHPGFTLASIISCLLMPLFILLIGKEIWEAIILERGGLRGRQALTPLALVLGGMLGGALVWQGLSALIETADEAAEAIGWVMPFGSDVALAFFFGRMIFGRGHAALQVLLFICILDGLLGLALVGLAAPVGMTLHPQWLLLPVLAALAGYLMFTRPLHRADVTERDRQRASQLWPWCLLGLASWVGVSMAGLPPALGLLPLLPAMPHGDHSFGVFAEAEEFLTDPLNRATVALHGPVIVVLFLFALTHGALDMWAFAPTTWVTLGAYWIGKPLGMMAVAALILALGRPLPQSLPLRDMAVLAGLMGIGFSIPLMSLETALPGGAMQEAARLGLGLSLLAGPALVLLMLRHPPHGSAKPKRQ